MKRTLFALAFAAVGVIANAAVDMDHINNVGPSIGTIMTPPATNAFGVMQIFPDFPTLSGTVIDDFNASGSIVNHVAVAFEAEGAVPLGNITGWQISIWNSVANAAASGNNLNLNTVAQTFIQGPGSPVVLVGPSLFSPTSVAHRIDFNGLNLNLGSTGHYWIGIAPVMAFAGNGQTFMLHNTNPAVIGAGTANTAVGINPSNGFGLGTSVAVDLNATYMVETQPVPEPASLAALGLGALALLRRRRKNA